MGMFVSKFLKWVLVSLTVVVLTACGGGSSGDGGSSDESAQIEISMSDNVIVPEEEIKVNSISTIPNDTSMLIDGEITDSNTLLNEIIFLPPSDTTPDGFFMKISKIEKLVDPLTGEINSKIYYTVPELDEVISELQIEEQNMVNDNLKVAQVVIPSSTEISSSSPSLKQYYKTNSNLNVMSAGGETSTGVMFGNSKGAIDIGYVGDEKNAFAFKFTNLEIWKDKLDSKTVSGLIALNGDITLKLNSITPVADISDSDDKYKLKDSVK